MTHVDSPDTKEDFQYKGSQIAMVKRGAFKFFSSVLARKIVDPPLSESDATPSLICVGPSVDSGESGWRAETGPGGQREHRHWSPTSDDNVPILKMQIRIKMTFISCQVSSQRNNKNQTVRLI